MSRAASPFAASFDTPEHSDVLLLVHTDCGTMEAKKGKGRDIKYASALAARTYHCHAVVLSVLSGFFKAQLSSAWREAMGPASGPKRTVDIHVEAEELDAFNELLKMIYSQTLPSPTLSQPLSFQCLRLADRFEAVSCMELLVGGLAATPSEAIDCALLKEVFQASPGVCVSRSYPALLESCSKALVRLSSDVPTVIKDKSLLQQFCSLPHAAVLAWVKSDDLQVHSENCCVFLLSAWVKANQNSTAEQHEELAHHIRVFHLGPAYLHHILPNLSWFKGCSNMELLPAVLSCIRAGIKMEGGLEAVKGKAVSNSSFALPPGWCAKPRRNSSSPRTCSWVLSSSHLKEANNGKWLLLSSAVSINGFLIRLQVRQVATPSSAPVPGKTLGLYLGIDGAAMARCGLPLPRTLLVQLKPPRVKVGSPGSEKREESVLYATAGRGLREAAALQGKRSFFGAAAPTFLELTASYLEAGQMHIGALFNSVDA